MNPTLTTPRLPIHVGPSNSQVWRHPNTSGVFKAGVGASIESPRSLWARSNNSFGPNLDDNNPQVSGGYTNTTIVLMVETEPRKDHGYCKDHGLMQRPFFELPSPKCLGTTRIPK